MTRRTKLSATFLSVLLALAAVGAVAVPVSAGGSEDTGGENPCEYTVTVGEANGTLEDSAFAGPGRPSMTIDKRTVTERDRVIETNGASVTFEIVQATMENVTFENDSTPNAYVGDGQLHARDVTITGPGLPDATIESETFVLRDETFSQDGNGDGDTGDADSTYTVAELRVSVENLVVRSTSEECAASTGGDKSKPDDSDSVEEQKSHENATMADGHDKSDEKGTDDASESTTETTEATEETTETAETTDTATETATATQTSNSEDTSSSESADAQANAERTETDGPGFGLVLGVIALLAAALFAVRRR